MQIAFTLYMIVLFPGGAPVVTNVGTWQKASDCGTAADAAFVRKNTEGEQVPSISFVCVPRSGFGDTGDREEGWVARWHPSRGPLHQGEYLTNVPRLDAAKRACEKHAKEQMQQALLKI